MILFFECVYKKIINIKIIKIIMNNVINVSILSLIVINIYLKFNTFQINYQNYIKAICNNF